MGFQRPCCHQVIISILMLCKVCRAFRYAIASRILLDLYRIEHLAVRS